MTELAREYGEGLFDLANEENLLDTIHEEMSVLRASFNAEPRFLQLLQSHALSRAERLAILDETFRGRINLYLLNFMKILFERGALYAFGECAAYFHERYCEAKGVVEAKVTSAVALTDAQRDALAQKLGALSGKKIALLVHVDPALIGGIRVEMNGRRYDNTIQHRLSLMRRRLTDEM